MRTVQGLQEYDQWYRILASYRHWTILRMQQKAIMKRFVAFGARVSVTGNVLRKRCRLTYFLELDLSLLLLLCWHSIWMHFQRLALIRFFN